MSNKAKPVARAVRLNEIRKDYSKAKQKAANKDEAFHSRKQSMKWLNPKGYARCTDCNEPLGSKYAKPSKCDECSRLDERLKEKLILDETAARAEVTGEMDYERFNRRIGIS